MVGLHCWQNVHVLGKHSISFKTQSQSYFFRHIFSSWLSCALINRAFVVFCLCSILSLLFSNLFPLSGVHHPILHIYGASTLCLTWCPGLSAGRNLMAGAWWLCSLPYSSWEQEHDFPHRWQDSWEESPRYCCLLLVATLSVGVLMMCWMNEWMNEFPNSTSLNMSSTIVILLGFQI